MDVTLVPGNGCSPDSISKAHTPSEKMSLRPSSLSPIACSGDMYDGVPRSVPDCVISASTSFAIPKSVTLTLSPSYRMRFEGLMSRWMTPLLCA